MMLLRQRFKDGVALEQLAGQIGNTTGAIRLIEEQLSSRHRGLEMVKEGQVSCRGGSSDNLYATD